VGGGGKQTGETNPGCTCIPALSISAWVGVVVALSQRRRVWCPRSLRWLGAPQMHPMPVATRAQQCNSWNSSLGLGVHTCIASRHLESGEAQGEQPRVAVVGGGVHVTVSGEGILVLLSASTQKNQTGERRREAVDSLLQVWPHLQRQYSLPSAIISQ
jgi:hypothetical protein